MTEHFEERHRELREAITDLNRALREPYLLDFEERIGPLVDDLVAAVRNRRNAPRDGSVDINALTQHENDALAALDEASRG